MKVRPKGHQASMIERGKKKLLAGVEIPKDGLPGSLALTHRRCGKVSCHCADSQGHPVWSLTYMIEGKKRVERIPNDWVEYVQQKVNQGKEFKEGVNRVFLANAELLVLLRKQKQRT